MIVIDVETTGVNPIKHSIASIGALEFENPENQFYFECKIWDGAEITDFASEINGFSRESLTNLQKPRLEEAMHFFSRWAERIEDRTFAGENVGHFDMPFLEHSFKLANLPWIFGYRSLDLHTLSAEKHFQLGIPLPREKKFSGLTLDKTLAFTGLLSEPKPHNALTGAKLEAEAFARLRYGQNLLKEYSKFNMPEYLKK